MSGLYFEEFEVGMEFKHALTRTVTEMDNVLFTALTHNPQPLHLDAEFAKEHPKIAGRLGLEGLECADPYVERLLEGFSFLAARVQLKMDAEFPQFTQHAPSGANPRCCHVNPFVEKPDRTGQRKKDCSIARLFPRASPSTAFVPSTYAAIGCVTCK